MSIYKMRTEFGHYLKWLLGLIALIFLIGGIWSFGTAPGQNVRKPGEGEVIATVNGEKITRDQYNEMWQQWYEQAQSRRINSPLQFARMRAMLFQQLVSDTLAISTAEEMGVDISDRTLNDQLDKFVTQYLRQDRQRILGKLSSEREAVDPRDDSEYKKQLESMGTSIDQVEEQVRKQVSMIDAKAQMARQGIQQKLQAQVKPVDEKDIVDSFKTYGIRVITLPLGNLPKAQVSNKASKIQAEAAAGADFAKLARENSEGASKNAGEIVTYDFQTSMGYPPEVREAITKMKPGEISRAIETPVGYYIIKLESENAGASAKLDSKARSQRRQELTQQRMAEAMVAFQRQQGGKQKVTVTDPEMRAYWQIAQAQQTSRTPAEYKKNIASAIASLKQAIGSRGNTYASINLADLLYKDGQIDAAIRVLYPLVEGDNASVEGADVRMLLGDMMMKSGQKADREAAVKQYTTASEVAQVRDVQTHEQLAMKFQQLKRPDLAANEQKLVAQYKKQMEQYEQMNKGRRPAATGAPSERP